MKALCSLSFPAQDEKLFSSLSNIQTVINLTAAAIFFKGLHYDREQQEKNTDAVIFSSYLFLRVFITVTSDI